MKQIYIATSKIHGKGIRAGENIKKGEVVTRIKGPLKFKINKDKEDAIGNPDWVGVKKDIWIDPFKPHKFLNHSCNPSAGMRGLTLVSLKKISEGEEITIDYSIIEGDNLWEMRCACHNANCRNIIRSIQFLPKDTFRKYLPYIPAYFRNLHLRFNKNDFSKIKNSPK